MVMCICSHCLKWFTIWFEILSITVATSWTMLRGCRLASLYGRWSTRRQTQRHRQRQTAGRRTIVQLCATSNEYLSRTKRIAESRNCLGNWFNTWRRLWNSRELKLTGVWLSVCRRYAASLHRLRITERIEYKLLSLTYKVLTTTQPPYLHKLISAQRPRCTRSTSSLKLTDRSFRYASPCLWHQLPLSLRIPHSGTSSSISYSPIPSPITSSSSYSRLCTSITPCLFHPRLKTFLFHKSYRL